MISNAYLAGPNLRPLHRLNLFFHGTREFRVFRRRRLKRRRGISLSSDHNPIGDLLRGGLTPTSTEILAPALGIVSGLAAMASRFGLVRVSGRRDVGEWILFTSPTPFNRFVLLRCPSISFEGGELLEGVNERLVKEDKHYVRLNSGRVLAKPGGEIEDLERKLEYRRVCVSTDDGGVVSLDWPANLDLTEEHGLDTTVLIIPGSAQGSMDAEIRSFVCEALTRGCFPIVMNPRGCAGSPLTTARLFTAADSDDIATTVQFINKERPWTTLMGIGWGYGANMLTKYLAESGEATPLTAATCIDNPFDLEEATSFSPRHVAVDQKLTGGLVDILKSNKELFRGGDKEFNVEKALTAKSLRDFEKAISMVSHGFEDLEDFYSVSSTRNLIGDVKIPVLFIQNDDGSAPLFSIPRSSIAENPFTSLLLCSRSLSSGAYGCQCAITWCQQLTLEWLAGVELGLLKGRHPLLEDMDITINPSKGLAFVEGKPSNSNTKITKLSNSTPLSSRGYTKIPANDTPNGSATASSLILRPRKDFVRKYGAESRGLQNLENDALKPGISADAELVELQEQTPIETEASEMLQTAQVVMNMLDVTMPGTLTEEKKKKVLAAIGRGDTLMKALQDAVPDDVRAKLTTAVTGILRSQDTQLKIKELLRVSRSQTSSGLKPSVEEKVRETSNIEGLSQDLHSSDQIKKVDSVVDGAVTNQPDMQMPPGGIEAEPPHSESSQKLSNLGQPHSTGEGSDDSTSTSKETDSRDSNDGKGIADSETVERELETGAKGTTSVQVERKGSDEEAKLEEHKGQIQDHNAKIDEKQSVQVERKGSDEEAKLEEHKGQIQDHNAKIDEKQLPDPKPGGAGETSSPSGSSSDSQSIPKEDTDNQKKEISITEPDHGQSRPNSESSPSSFSVTQALDALTGMDDSTQVAVNSVFGVIEEMITQLEGGSNLEDGLKNEKKASGPALPNGYATGEQKLKSLVVDQSLLVDDGSGGNSRVVQHQSPISHHGSEEQFSVSNFLHHSSTEKEKLDDSHAYINSYSYGNYSYNDHVQNNLFSEIPIESLDSDATTALLLEYFPEEGQWKLLEQSGNGSLNGDQKKVNGHSPGKEENRDDVVEPLYTILDAEWEHDPVEELDENMAELMQFVKKIIFDDLLVEVGRKLGSNEIDPNLIKDVEQVSNVVSVSVGDDVKHALSSGVKFQDINEISEKVDTLNGERIIRTISAAVQETTYLRRILPVGLIVGSSLAALRKFFNVVTGHEGDASRDPDFDETPNLRESDLSKRNGKVFETRQTPSQKSTESNGSRRKNVGKTEPNNNKNATVMVGAVTAAIGASTLLVQNQDLKQTNGALASSSKSSKIKSDNQQETSQVEESLSESNHQNIVASLAEKAMSIAGPVVPTTEDGQVDQERLVTMLADLGQKGGMLRLVGKVALLWGGIRGAMSLTDKLILFLHIAERPLIQRILGFAGMVLVIWSPVVVPLLPTLVQSWSTKNPARIAELPCIVGLYTAAMILVMQWGRRIRGYENPLEQYGLDLTSLPKIRQFVIGLIGGIVFVSSIETVNALLGCVTFSWPYSTTSLDAMTWLKVYGKMLVIAAQGLVAATGVALVEELLFRSWLPEEIAADLGYHRGIIISGLIFSLLQRSLLAIPGLWLLSLSLSGIRQRSQGSLSAVIGLRSGILASIFVLQRGGFLTYKANFSLWLTGTYPFQPLSGVTGLAFSFVLALFLYPRQPLETKNTKIEIPG